MSDLATKNFKWSELECKCGCGTKFIAPKALEALQALRDLVGKPIRILSAARCPKHNWHVGGAKRSKHLSYQVYGKTICSTAFDIDLDGHDRADLIAKAKSVGFNGIGNYRQFVHVDIREQAGTWNN